MAAPEFVGDPPTTLSVNPETIPAALKAKRQWVCWDWEWRLDRDGNGKWTKPPLHPRREGYAKSNDSKTWGAFDEALQAYHKRDLPGIGFALNGDRSIFFVDLDHCRDPETGAIAPWAKRIIRAFQGTYSEISPTSTGIKIIGYGTLPRDEHTRAIGDGNSKLECFDQTKYTTLTGHRLEGAAVDLVDCQETLNRLYQDYFPVQSNVRFQAAEPSNDDDTERLARLRASKQGPAFDELFLHGNLARYNNDHSSADQALANILAFWFGPDPARIDRLFRQSALMRDKWDAKHYGDGRTYGQGTINEALAGRTEFYTPPRPLHVIPGGRSDDNHAEGPPAPPPSGEDPTTPPPAGDDRPAINAGDQNLERISKLAWDALERANKPPKLFRFGGVPVRVEGAEDDATPIAQTLNEDRLGHELARSAIWYKETERAGRTSAAPPSRMIKDMIAAPTYPLPSLINIVQVPTFAPDGSLQTLPGYHEAGRTFYAPTPGFTVKAVAARPTAAEIEQAKHTILDEMLGEFPFIEAAERANAVALLLDPYVRNLIEGPTPLRLIEAPTPGSGKGLLADAILRPAIGRRINVMPAANDDDEWRKRITAQLIQSPGAILIDNITKGLDSGALSSALTASWWTDRRLGAHEMVHVPVRCVWIATANNPTMSTELARRTVRIRLDPKQDRPWRRSGFRHEDLRTWVDDNRSEIVWSALTLVQAWLAAGSPLGTIKLGSFERWASVLGGILGNAGIDDFLGNLEVFYETADLEGAIWRQFVGLWAEKHDEQEVGVGDLFSLALTVDAFDFGTGSERAQKTAFGIALKKQRDRVIGDYRIVPTRTVQRVQRWRLIRSRPGENPFSAFYADDAPEGEEAS